VNGRDAGTKPAKEVKLTVRDTGGGARWTRIRSNLPTVPIYEITLHPRDNDMLLDVVHGGIALEHREIVHAAAHRGRPDAAEAKTIERRVRRRRARLGRRWLNRPEDYRGNSDSPQRTTEEVSVHGSPQKSKRNPSSI
jgi:hypothetical protein